MINLKLPGVQNYLHQVRTYLKENRVVMFGAAGAVLLLVLQLIVLPVFKYNKSVSRQEQIIGGQLEQVSALADEYSKLRKAATGSSSQKDVVNLFARLENLTRKLKVSSNVDFMRPSTKVMDDGRTEEEVYIRFKDILQKDFVNFLYGAEVKGGIVTVKQLRIKKNKQRKFDVDLTLTKSDG